ncbi:MAG: DUF2892 domain-containing protein [Bdellovibrionota bacterium]
MRINMAVWDRVIRLLFGTGLVAWAIAGGPWWAYLGLALLATAAWRFCPVYGIFRLSTLSQK